MQQFIRHLSKEAAFSFASAAALAILALSAHLNPALFSNSSKNSSATIEVLQTGSGGPRGWMFKTSVAVTYKDRVDAGASAEVEALVSQEFGPWGQAKAVDTLRQKLEITLSIEGKKDTKTLDVGAPLPARLLWAPVLPSNTKEVTAILSVKPTGERLVPVGLYPDLHVSINGQDSVVHTSDDIRLPITVYAFFMTARRWEFVCLIASIGSFILGCAFLTSVFSNFWASFTGRRTQDYS